MKSYDKTTEMKAADKYFPVVLFSMLCNLVLTFYSANESLSVTIQIKGTEQYFPVARSNMLCKVVLTF